MVILQIPHLGKFQEALSLLAFSTVQEREGGNGENQLARVA